MSYTQIYTVNPNGYVTLGRTVPSAFLGAMHVWTTLNIKYDFQDNIFEFKNTWGNFNKGFYEHYEDVILGSTFDYVMVRKEEIGELIKAFTIYHNNYEGSNYEEQIKALKELEKEDIIAVAWCQTSVVNDLWHFDYDSELEVMIPYNIYKGTKHWFLFDELNKVAEAE